MFFPIQKGLTPLPPDLTDRLQRAKKHQRVERLTALSDSLYNNFIEKNRGRGERVLYESTVKGGKMFGYTGNYIRIESPYDGSLIGKICDIVI
jgi:2-methylthioadenine synthetase